MKAGILHQMWSEDTETDRQAIDRAISDATLAEELGYDAFWFGEHHFGSLGPLHARVPVPELLVAHIAAATERIRLGTGIKVLTFDTPARFCESMALLDIITNGRALFGIGSGTTLPEERVRALSTERSRYSSDEQKTELFQKHLSELSAYLANDDSDGRLQVTPTPSPELRSRVWVGSRTPASVALAARLGFNLILGQAETGERQAPYAGAYREASGAGEIRGLRVVHVAETDDEAFESVADAATAYFAVMTRSASNHVSGAPVASFAEMLDRTSFIAGSPTTVADQMQRYSETVGAHQVDALMHVPGIAPDAVRRSMSLYAGEVVPLLPVGNGVRA